MYMVPGGQKKMMSPWDWSYRRCEPPSGVLGIEPLPCALPSALTL